MHAQVSSDGGRYEKRVDAQGRESEAVCIDDEIPFEIPDGWEWCRLSSLSSAIHYGFTSSSSKSGRIKLLRITDIQDGCVNWDNVPYCTKDPKDLNLYRLCIDDILIARTGGTIGKNFRILDDPPVSVFASYLIRVVLVDSSICSYLDLFFDAPCYWNQLSEKTAGTGQPNVNGQSLANLLIPLPPHSEQERIVKKYDEVKRPVSQYGALEEAREALDAGLPGRLRGSVLREAVRGGLVPQDPSDEPASALLGRIRDQRGRLVAEGRLRAPKGGDSVIYRGSDGGHYEKCVDVRGREGEPVRIDDEIPFEIPESWAWARLKSIFDMQAGKNIQASSVNAVRDEIHPYPCFGGNGIRGYTELPNRKGVFPVIGRQGALCGCVNKAEGEFYATEHAVVVSCFGGTDVDWAATALEALNLNQYATATAQPGLAVSKMGEVLIPVPPVEEQRRIATSFSTLRKLTSQ